jgi:hypothetical protein
LSAGLAGPTISAVLLGPARGILPPPIGDGAVVPVGPKG